RRYGDTLIHCAYRGDYKAQELTNTTTLLFGGALPFNALSIRTVDDSGRMDRHTNDTSSRTYVHVAVWIDTLHASRENARDTMLYITNLRTDDSDDTRISASGSTSVGPSTIDRRFVMMRMNARHSVSEVGTTNNDYSIDLNRVKTPYVD